MADPNQQLQNLNPNDLMNLLALLQQQGGTIKIGNQVLSLKVENSDPSNLEKPKEPAQTEVKQTAITSQEEIVAEKNLDEVPQEKKNSNLILPDTPTLVQIHNEKKDFSFMRTSSGMRDSASADSHRTIPNLANRTESNPLSDKGAILIHNQESNENKDSSFCSTASLVTHLIQQTERKSRELVPIDFELEKKLSSIPRSSSQTAKPEELYMLDTGNNPLDDGQPPLLLKTENTITNDDNTTVTSQQFERSRANGSNSSQDLEEEKDLFDTNELESVIQKDPNLIKYYNMLRKKERNLRKKEKSLEEKIQANANRSISLSSTQYSADTQSTGFCKSKELEQMINGILAEAHGEPIIPPQQTFAEANLHFAFLFSAPLVLVVENGQQKTKKCPIYMEVDYRSELDTTKRILGTARNEVKFRSFAATQSGLGECLNMKPRAIHFCGHGVKNTQENFGIHMKSGEGDFLLFEDDEAKADFLSCKSLKNLLREKKLDQSIDFVFVASCHSSLVGEVFKDAGAKHVICVEREHKILDQACQEFTKHFYLAYFTGNFSVCEAFKNAKEHLKSIKGLPVGEENKFVMLYDDNIFQQHACSSIFPISKNLDSSQSLLKDLTPVPPFHKIPARVEHFIGRHNDLHDVIKLIKKQRFITIKGIPGIGKSSLSKQLINFFYERGVFRDGYIYVSLNGCDTIEGLISTLDSKLGYISKKVDSKKEGVGYLISQVAHSLSEKFENGLLVLDNVDQVQNSERARFRELIEMILSTCSKIKLLITSRSPIGGSIQDVVEKVFTLTHLDPPNSRELFFTRTPRPIQDREIQELLEYQLTSSELEMISTQGLDHLRQSKGPHSSGGLQKQLCTPGMTDHDTAFETHHMMQILGGHPQAISLASALLVEDRSLKELYKLLISHPILEVLKAEDLSEDEKQSMNSMQVSLDVSVSYLKKRHCESVRFFGMLGLLPGGGTDNDFDFYWGKGWTEHVTLLLRYSLILKQLLNNGMTRYILYPFMLKYAEKRLEHKDYIIFSSKMVKHLKERAKDFYFKIGNCQEDSHVYFDLFLQEESNLKACIKREVVKAEEKGFKKSGTATPEEEVPQPDSDRFTLTKGNLEVFKNFTSAKYDPNFKARRKISKEDDDETTVVASENVVNLLSSMRASQRQTMVNDSKLKDSPEENPEKLQNKKLFEQDVSMVSSIIISEQGGGGNGLPTPSLSKAESFDFNIAGENDSQNLSNNMSNYFKENLSSSFKENNSNSFDPTEHVKVVAKGRLSILPKQNQLHTLDVSHDLSKFSNFSNISQDRSKTPDKDNSDVTPKSSSVTFNNTTELAGEQNISVEFINGSLNKTGEDVSNPESAKGSHHSTPMKQDSRPPKHEIEIEDVEEDSLVMAKLIPTPRFTSLDTEEGPEIISDPNHKHKGKIINFDNLKLTKEVSMRDNFFFGQSPTQKEVQNEADRIKRDSMGTEGTSEQNIKNSIGSNNTGTSNPRDASPVNGIPLINTEMRLSGKDSNSHASETPRLTANTNKDDSSKNSGGIDRVCTEPDDQNTSDNENIIVKAKMRASNNLLTETKSKDMKSKIKKPSTPTPEELSDNGGKTEKEKPVPPKTSKSIIASTKKIPIVPKETPATSSVHKFPFPNEKKEGDMTNSCHLSLLYSSILFLLRRFHECDKAIYQGMILCKSCNDKLAEANFLKLRGCLFWIKKNFKEASKNFGEACDLFKESGCSLGIAICDAAVGYIKAKMTEENTNAGIKKLENSLSIYKTLNHVFGIHYIHRLLAGIMNKMPQMKNLAKQHSSDSRKILLNVKKPDLAKQKHKAGMFVVRWMGDAFSIFIEIAEIKDIKPQKPRISDNTDSKQNQLKKSNPSVVINESMRKSMPKNNNLKVSGRGDLNEEEEKVVKNNSGTALSTTSTTTSSTALQAQKKKTAVMSCFKNKTVKKEEVKVEEKKEHRDGKEKSPISEKGDYFKEIKMTSSTEVVVLEEKKQEDEKKPIAPAKPRNSITSLVRKPVTTEKKVDSSLRIDSAMQTSMIMEKKETTTPSRISTLKKSGNAMKVSIGKK